MRISTPEELEDKLNDDLAWRRKELSEIYNNIQRATSIALNTNLRIGVVMLYAHWEGFIKTICELYLIYVNQRRLNYSELRDNFVAIKLLSILDKNDSTLSENCATLAIKFIRESLGTRAFFRSDIETKSNLNSEVFQDILKHIGLDYSKYVVKSKLIDERLLKNRNSIAHGNYLPLDINDYKILYDEITGIMIDIKTTISNNAALQMYKLNVT